MIQEFKPMPHLPPRLTMDEYVVFVSESLRHGNREFNRIQKELEDCISKPFCLPKDEQPHDPLD